MVDKPNNRQEVIDAYRQRAPRYNLAVNLFDVFAWFGFNISGWRRQAVSALNLKPGDTVVDIGCGTGLNFPLLHRAVGPEGTIIGGDMCFSSCALMELRPMFCAVVHGKSYKGQ